MIADAARTATFHARATAQGVVPVLVVESAATILPLADALQRGGITCIEITLRTPAAPAAIEAVRRTRPEIAVAVGTVWTADDWRVAEGAGADLIVSPGATEALCTLAAGSAVDWLPGARTPSEVARLVEQGHRIVKWFPARESGGPAGVRAITSVFADVRLCPTGGIDAVSAPDYLAEPAVAWVGGSWLAPPARVATGDWHWIESSARQAAGIARPVR